MILGTRQNLMMAESFSVNLNNSIALTFLQSFVLFLTTSTGKIYSIPGSMQKIRVCKIA